MAVGNSTFPEMNPVNGFSLGTSFADVKGANPSQPTRDDITVMMFPDTSTVAGVFTQNAFCAAPVLVCRENLKNNIRILVTNSGNANACTGDQGLADAQAINQKVADLVDVNVDQVLPFSTGVIGEHLPTDRILNALPDAINNLSEDNWDAAGRAIMTTDTRPKGASRKIEYQGQVINITGISKGAGMIKPNMATMLGYVATDAQVEKGLLQKLLAEGVEKSFNRITVDGDTSTNDSCVLVATGTSIEVNENNSELFELFTSTLNSVLLEIAKAIVADGEGATKLVSVVVENAESSKEALRVAYSVAQSPLVKTALFASDPNWGRIVAAIGYAGVQGLDVSKIDVYLGDVLIVASGGRAESYVEEAGAKVMSEQEIEIRINLRRGDSQEIVWTTDLSYDYVKINAEYRS